MLTITLLLRPWTDVMVIATLLLCLWESNVPRYFPICDRGCCSGHTGPGTIWVFVTMSGMSSQLWGDNFGKLNSRKKVNKNYNNYGHLCLSHSIFWITSMFSSFASVYFFRFWKNTFLIWEAWEAFIKINVDPHTSFWNNLFSVVKVTLETVLSICSFTCSFVKLF